MNGFLSWLLKRCACCGADLRHARSWASLGIGGYLCGPCTFAPCLHHLYPGKAHWEHRVVVR